MSEKHRNQYSDNPRGICCNTCYRVLTNKELEVYSYTWQHSGDMYCMQHRNCPDDCRWTPCALTQQEGLTK